MAMRTGVFLIAALAATAPRAVGQARDRLDLVREYLGRSRTDSAAAALEPVFANADAIPVAERADAWLLRGLLEYVAGRDSAGRAAMRIALEHGGAPSLGGLAPRYAQVAVVWASEKAAWRYERDGRPLDRPGTPPEGTGAETFPDPVRTAIPNYPGDLARQNIEGDVLVVAVVGPDGRADERWVEVAYATSDGFAEPAVRAVLQSRFSSATRAGQPIAALVRMPVRFRLYKPGERLQTADELLELSRRVARKAPDSAAVLARAAMDPALGASRRHRAAGFAVLAAGAKARGDSAAADDELRMVVLVDSAWARESLPKLHPELAGLLPGAWSALAARDSTPISTGALDEAPRFERGAPVPWPPDVLYGASGSVRMRAVVGADGRVEPRSIVILSHQHPGFDAAAVEFAVKARFRPARVGGQPVRALVTIPLQVLRPPIYLESVVEQKPEPIEGPMLIYPEDLRRARVQGRVLVEAVLDTLGWAEPLSIRIVSSPHPGFDGPARGYMRWARFRPARVGGRAVRVLVRLPIDFKLRGG